MTELNETIEIIRGGSAGSIVGSPAAVYAVKKVIAPEVLRANDDLAKGGVKFDEGKFRWSLLPWDAVQGILSILEFGAKKYAPRNWEQGMDWSRPYDAAVRHMMKWWQGETKDPDSGYSHLWHAGCNLLFLIAYEIRSKGKDDRPR